MTRRKKVGIVFLGIIGGILTYASLMATFIGLAMLIGIPRPYVPKQPRDQIQKIEICQHEEDDIGTHVLTTLKTFEGQEQEAFLEELLQVPCRGKYGPATDTIGDVVVCIYYKDNTVEVLGNDNLAKIHADGEWDIYMPYMKSEEFCHLLLKHVDKDQVPEYYVEDAAKAEAALNQ